MSGDLHQISQAIGQLQAAVEAIPHHIADIGKKLDDHATRDDERLTALEHDATRAKATIRALAWGGGALGAANVWAIIKGGLFGMLK